MAFPMKMKPNEEMGEMGTDRETGPGEVTPAYSRVKKGKSAPFGRRKVGNTAPFGGGAASAFLKGLGAR